MPGAWWSKVGITIVLTVFAILSLVPTLYPVPDEMKNRPEAAWPGWVQLVHSRTGNAKITLGLDLQGGLHLQYRADVDKAIDDKVDQYVADLGRRAQESWGSGYQVERIPGAFAIRVVAPAGQNATGLLDDNALDSMSLIVVRDGANGARYEVDSRYIEETKRYAVEQAIATIEARINETGVAEPSISRRGNTDIVVQLPGLDESEFDRMKDLISQTAQLSFRMVSDQDGSYFMSAPGPSGEGWSNVGGRPHSDVARNAPEERAAALERIREFYQNVTPPAGTIFAYTEVTRLNEVSGQFDVTGYQPRLLESTTELTGEYITDARTGTDPRTNRPVVNMTFDGEGTRLFANLTTRNVNRQMAIVLDDIVNSAPNINEPITGGRVQITLGGNSYRESLLEAQSLAIVLRNGALPAPIEKQFETQVGPSLGADTIRSGTIAMVVAFFAVIALVVFRYRWSGVITSVALALNVLFIGSALALLHATLTLPGIAGVVLTIGMAVDANVIIFERIREEFREGKSVRAAINAGYEKAFSAVIDGNITTAVAGLVLMEFGSGPVRGFAVTLLIGIISSLFTALTVTRLIYDFLLDRVKITRIGV